MKLSELMAYAKAAFENWGDLDCFMDINGDDKVYKTVEFACETNNARKKRIIITSYNLPYPPLKVVK